VFVRSDLVTEKYNPDMAALKRFVLHYFNFFISPLKSILSFLVLEPNILVRRAPPSNVRTDSYAVFNIKIGQNWFGWVESR
jgi:hypothetical protein